MEARMIYSLSSVVRISTITRSQMERVKREHPWLKIENIPGSADTFRVCHSPVERFPWWGDWRRFFVEPTGAGKLEIFEIGIRFTPATVTDVNGRRELSGEMVGYTCLDGYNTIKYLIRGNEESEVSKERVGIFLPAKEQGWPVVPFDAWNAFWHVAYRYDKVFRAMRKLDQLRGARKNSGAYERLSGEIHEILSSALTGA
jgi:hypothetical protein